jgi:maltose/moltooligosaccharide transporter
MGVAGSTPSGIPLSVKYSFQIGALVFLVAVLWTVVTSKEYPPEDLESWAREKRATGGVGHILREIGTAIRDMPITMRQLAVVQVFTWLGLFCMWLFFVPATARHVFGATDVQSDLYTQGVEWGGFTFAFYSVTCFLVALALPKMAALTSRKLVHAFALTCGAAGLLSVYFIHNQYLLLLSMIGVGIAWASILSMPYAILSTAVPAKRMGVYMGVFNFFIVIPEIIASLGFGPLIRLAFGESNPNAPLYIVMLGGACMLTAAALVGVVRDVGGEAEGEGIDGGRREGVPIPEGV